MTNALASVGMCWRPVAVEPAANELIDAAHPWATAMPQAHEARLYTHAAAARLRGYAFAIRPRGTPPV